MKNFFSKFFLVFLASIQLQAADLNPSTANINTLVTGLMEGFGMSNKGTCKETPESIKEEPAEIMMEKGRALLQKNKYCDAAGVFYQVRKNYPVKPYYKEAWIQMIIAYMLAGEAELVANWGNRFIETEMVGTPEAEDVQYYMLRVLYDKMANAREGTSVTSACQLLAYNKNDCSGVHVDLTDPIDRNRTLKAYFEKYPEGKYIKDMKYWESECKNKIAKHSFMIAKYYESRGQLVQAIGRYRDVNMWGPTMDVFEIATYNLIADMKMLSKEVLNPDSISQSQLEAMSAVEVIQNGGLKKLMVQSITRQEMSEMLLNQARQLAETFYAKFPKSDYAKQSAELFNLVPTSNNLKQAQGPS